MGWRAKNVFLSSGQGVLISALPCEVVMQDHRGGRKTSARRIRQNPGLSGVQRPVIVVVCALAEDAIGGLLSCRVVRLIFCT